MKGRIFLVILVLLFAIAFSGCEQLQPVLDSVGDQGITPEEETSPSTNFNNFQKIVKEPDQIILGSFNIQVFGKTKAAKPEVMDILDAIISQYDIIAIQEVRDSSGEAIKQLAAMLPEYEYKISERLGRTNSKEQYVFFWNNEIVRFVEDFTFEDTEDLFEREPFIARFEHAGTTFTVLNNHIKPDNAAQEIRDLNIVLDKVRKIWTAEEEIIILGDLNADCSYYPAAMKNTHVPDMIWLMPDNADTTVSTTDCAYDRFIITEEVMDNVDIFGIDYFDKKFLLTQEKAKEVSDHYPIYMILDFVED